MDRDDLLNEIIRREAQQRFYEAAEGAQYFAETEERERNYVLLRTLVARLTALDRGRYGVTVPTTHPIEETAEGNIP